MHWISAKQNNQIFLQIWILVTLFTLLDTKIVIQFCGSTGTDTRNKKQFLILFVVLPVKFPPAPVRVTMLFFGMEL